MQRTVGRIESRGKTLVNDVSIALQGVRLDGDLIFWRAAFALPPTHDLKLGESYTLVFDGGYHGLFVIQDIRFTGSQNVCVTSWENTRLGLPYTG